MEGISRMILCTENNAVPVDVSNREDQEQVHIVHDIQIPIVIEKVDIPAIKENA